MAKTGNVTTTGGTSDSIKAAVMGDLTPNLTLGQVVANALGGSEDDLVVTIDLENRTVKVKGTASAADLPAHGAHGAEFTLDDDTKKVAPWTGAGLAEIIAISNTAAKPQRSLASLISAIEDAETNEEIAFAKRIVVDQVNEKVIVYNGDVDTLDFVDFDAAADLAAFEAPVEVSGGVTHGPFE